MIPFSGGGSYERTWSASRSGGTWRPYIQVPEHLEHLEAPGAPGASVPPESQMPLHYLHLGEVRAEVSDRCLDTMSRKAGQKVGAWKNNLSKSY